MKDYGKQRSTVKPDEMVVDEFSVWNHTNITEVSENVGAENEFIGFEFNMIQYTKDEFIKLQTEKSASLEKQLTDTQLALVEIYESMGV